MRGFETVQASESEAVDRSSKERSAGDGTLEEVLEENLEGEKGRGLTDRRSAASHSASVARPKRQSYNARCY
jgi:hypothetical protein